MKVSVERYQRKKYAGKTDSPTLFYLRQKAGDGKTMTTQDLTQEIQDNSSLKKGEVLHVVEEIIDQIIKNLTKGNKVKLNGLGTFHMTLNSLGSATEKDCTVKSISKVNIRFMADKEIKLVNGSSINTRSPNAIEFTLDSKEKEPSDGGSDGDGGDVIDPME